MKDIDEQAGWEMIDLVTQINLPGVFDGPSAPPGSWTDTFDPLYSHREEYEQGQVVGEYGYYAIQAAEIVYEAPGLLRQVPKGLRAARDGGLKAWNALKNRFLTRSIPQNSSASPFGAGGLWNTIDEAVDPSVIRQLDDNSCGPSCGAMLLRGEGYAASQSAIAVRQGSALTVNAQELAAAMNQLKSGWTGGFYNVTADFRAAFSMFNKNGAFATTLRTPGMRVSHMVVVDGLDELGRVIIRDPADGTRYLMSWEDFTKVWEGQTVFR